MSIDRHIHKKSLFSVALAMILPALAGAEGFQTKPFHPAFVALEAGAVWHASATAAGQTHCAELDLATPGILSLEARVGATAESEPRLIHVDGLQGPIIARWASHLTYLAPAGRQRFCVRDADPRLGLDELEIVTAFVELAPNKDGNPDDGGGEGEDPREMESEPEGLRTDLCAFGFGKDGNPDDGGGEGEDPREMESEPEGSRADPCGLARPLAELCHRLQSAGGDDHGDTFLCASRADRWRPLAAVLDSTSSQDRDVFELVVSELETLRIGTSGAVDTFGSLYTEQGYRLAAGDEGGHGENFRLVKTLLPGRYFIHIESARYDTGDYMLHVDAVP